MSGPKVVRIVTREEMIAIGKDHLAQFETTLRRWEKVGLRNELLCEEEIEGTRKRHAELRALLAADQFADLRTQVRDEIACLTADMERRLTDGASKTVAARAYASRLVTMAQQTLDRGEKGQQVLSDTLKRELQTVIQSHGADRKHAEKTLADVLSSSITGASATVTPEQRALAERLRGGETTKVLVEWLKSTLPESDAIAVKAEEAIEELAMIAGGEESAPFAERYRALTREASKIRRQMLADTLMLDVGKALADAKATAEQLNLLEQKSATLSSVDTPRARHLAGRVTVALAERDAALARVLMTEIASLLEEEWRTTFAKAQRSAIVTALNDLGYEVREGLETAAPKEGKVILRRAANPEMGVEIVGIQGGGRVQFRPVRFGPAMSAGDHRKDRDIETIWCSDFESLNGRMGANGTLNVEQALPVGAIPVLFVEDSPSPDDRRPDVRKPARTRSLE